MNRKLVLLLILTAFTAWVAGCSDNPTEPDTLGQDPNLNDPFGGYTTSNEKPGFDDADLIAEADVGDEEEYDDPIMLSPAVDSAVSDTTADYYHLRVIWGQLPCDSSVTELTDWTGSLTVSRGVEVIRQVIRFELGQDYILTRTDPTLIEWVSFTSIHHDGIAVDIVVPPDTIATDPAPVTVTFDTGPYSRVFELDELAALDTIIYVEDSNAVAFRAMKMDHHPCRRGFLSGWWGYDENDEGVFEGVWMSRTGNVVGYLEGSWGVDDTEARVFYGKWISRDGQFEGLLSGTWTPHANMNANDNARRHSGGRFEGSIFDATGVEIGVLRGNYRSHPAFKRGYFGGRWKLFCNGTEPDVDAVDDGF